VKVVDHMTQTISTTRFRLLCREVASKVNARHGREEPTRATVLLELLRRVESHLGRKPGDTTSSAASIMEAFDRLVAQGASTTWSVIVDDELLGKVRLRDDDQASHGSEQKESRRTGT
jgi:hypothetical protein